MHAIRFPFERGSCLGLLIPEPYLDTKPTLANVRTQENRKKNYQEAESYICVKHNILRKNSPHPHSNKDKGAYKWHGIKYLEYIRSKVLVTKVETDSTFLSAGRIQISISNSVTSSSGDRDVTVTTTLHVIWCKTWQFFFLVASTRKSSVRKTHA